MKQMSVIQQEVGAWSVHCFGGQETKELSTGRDGRVQLGHLAPLMGLTEELGELHEATEPHDVMDALGDVLIYLCDFSCRLGVVITPPHISKPDLPHEALKGLVICVGRLNHAVLKRCQGIRGYDETALFRSEAIEQVNLIAAYVDKHLRSQFAHTNVLVLLNQVWTKVVSKRDWKANPTEGLTDVDASRTNGGEPMTPAPMVGSL